MVFARLTVLEAARRKVLWALVGLAVLIIGLSFWGFARLPAVHAFGTQLSGANSQLATAQLLGFVLFALSFVGALGMSFVAAPTIGGELESGVALSLLARPVRRSEVLLGKWLGLVSLAVAYVVRGGRGRDGGGRDRYELPGAQPGRRPLPYWPLRPWSC